MLFSAGATLTVEVADVMVTILRGEEGGRILKPEQQNGRNQQNASRNKSEYSKDGIVTDASSRGSDNPASPSPPSCSACRRVRDRSCIPPA